MTGATKWGSEFLVNTTTTSYQGDPSMTGLANGRFVVTWYDASNFNTQGWDVRAQIFNADGSKAGTEFVMNTTLGEHEYRQSVAALADGRFVTAWQVESQSGNDPNIKGIHAQIFNVDGSKAGGEFAVNTTTAGTQLHPAVAATADGHFAISWDDDSHAGGDASGQAVRTQVFNSDGTKSGGELLVNTAIAGDQRYSSISALLDGRFVVTWTDGSQSGGDASSDAVRAQFITTGGTKSGTEFLVNTTTSGSQLIPDVAGLADGRFVVGFGDGSQLGTPDDYNVRGQIFNPDHSTSGNEFLANTILNENQTDAQVAALPDGRYVMAWRDFSKTDGDVAGWAVHAQVFNANGSKSGSEFRVNTEFLGDQQEPTLSALTDGRFVVAWEDESHVGADPLGSGIHAQIFDPRDAGVTVSGTSLDDDFIGTNFADTLLGNGGSDRLDGRGGPDLLAGGAGDDMYFVDDALDSVVETAGNGATDRVFASVSFALAAGQEIEKLTTANNFGVTTINLTGNEFANAIFGNDGLNALDGKGGADTMVGFGGNDTYNVDNVNDQVIEAVGGGTDRVYASVSYTLGAGSQVEILSTGNNLESAPINLTGNASANQLIGNAGNNILDGGGNADSMIGFDGNDWYFVDDANDTIVEFAGSGVMDRVFASTSYTLGAGVEVEKFSTTDHAGLTNLTLAGNELANTIYGNAGSNALKGGLGNDTLVGMGGSDAFCFNTALNAATNVDTIADFNPVDDDFVLGSWIFTTIAPGTLSAGAFVVGAAAGEADDRIVYDIGTGALFYDADGVGGAAGVQFAAVSAGLALTNADFLVV